MTLNKSCEVFQKPAPRVDACSESKDLHRANTVASITLDVAVWRHLFMKTTNKESEVQNAEDYNDPWQELQTVQTIPPTKEQCMLFVTRRLHRSRSAVHANNWHSLPQC